MLTIPGVETVHERSAWEPVGYRMALDFTRTPALLNPGSVDEDALHYTADDNLPDGDFGEFVDQLPTYLAAITKSYLQNRSDGGYVRRSDGFYFPGYPIGYSFAVDWLGGVWVLRGWDYVPAATSGHNGHTIAILLLTDLADPGSDLMWRSVRCIRREAVRRKMRLPNSPTGHGEFVVKYGTGTRTSCPGGPLLRQRDEGLGDLDYPDVPEEDEMHPFVALYRPIKALVDRGLNKTFVLLRDGSIRHATGPCVEEAEAVGASERQIKGEEHYKQCDALSKVNEVP